MSCRTGCYIPRLTTTMCLSLLLCNLCITYPVSTILPPHAVCPLNDARWGLCWMNFQILIITLSVVGAVIILAFIVCLLCCCKCQNCGSMRVLTHKTKHQQLS
uniref:PTTG1 interacting protein n=1 Tax=Gadus morhua TaxID=8049 RepID=A0A8C5AUK1_GADMO